MRHLLSPLDLSRIAAPRRDGAQALDHVKVETLVPTKYMAQDLIGTSPRTGALPSVDTLSGSSECTRQFADRERRADARPSRTVNVNRGAEQLRPDRPERHYPGLQGSEVILNVPSVRDRALPGALLPGGSDRKIGSVAGVLEFPFKKKSCQAARS